MLLIVEVVMWRDVKMVEVRDVISGLFARALVWGDVDPHGGGLGACEPDGCTVVVEVRATALARKIQFAQHKP